MVELEIENKSSAYKNLISYIGIDRSVNSIECIKFNDINNEIKFQEFIKDINTNNDIIELNLIKNKAYKEAVIITLHINSIDKNSLIWMIKDEQKTFGGSKLFYINDNFDRLLVISSSGSIEGKFNMAISRMNKINEKISRLNSRIRKENQETYIKKHGKDKKDAIINVINANFKA